MAEDHEHDRFLYLKDGSLHFGCVNPFCGHGHPALPHHYLVPLESRDVIMRLISHSDRRLKIEVTPRKSLAYGPAIMEVADNLEACSRGFLMLNFPAR